MKEIDAWFRKAAKRQGRLVTLYSSLLRNRLMPYFVYRLRYLLVLQLLVLIVHVAEFLILFSHLQHFSVILIFLLRAGTLLVRGGWWGALEVMRERLRGLVGADAMRRSGDEVSSWLVGSLLISSILIVMALAICLLYISRWDASGADAIVYIYALLIAVELAVRLPTVTLHSGIYATRRVYRPFVSMLFPTVVQIAVLAALYAFDPLTALIASIIASTACSIAVTYIYTLRMYRIAGMVPNLRRSVRSFGTFATRLPLGRLALSAGAGLALRVDSLLVLALLGLGSLDGETISLVAGHPQWNTPHVGVFFYLILPTVRGSFEWSVLFYFDLVRLRNAPPLRDLAHMFFLKLLFAAVAVALYFWLLSVAVAVAAYRDISIVFLAALLPLFILRAWLGLLQVRAFANAELAVVCGSVLVLIIGLALVLVGEFADRDDLVQVMVCVVAAGLILLLGHFYAERRRKRPVLLSLNDWCDQLALADHPVQVGQLRIAEGLYTRHRSATAELLSQRLAGIGHCAWRSRSTLIYSIQVARGTAPVFDGYDLVAGTGGIVHQVRELELQSDGRAACDAMVQADWFRASDKSVGDLQSLCGEFHANWPNGTIIDLHSGKRAADVARIGADIQGSALPLAMASLRSGSVFTSRAGTNIFPLFVSDRLRMLFVVPADDGPPLSSQWVDSLHDWQISALTGERSGNDHA
ncbi:MAG: hypothetical protein GY789_04395 [Hyphomicrobiales bacterium]|nr:hypothetical protein [Hyphomicrobiales bacterium]